MVQLRTLVEYWDYNEMRLKTILNLNFKFSQRPTQDKQNQVEALERKKLNNQNKAKNNNNDRS